MAGAGSASLAIAILAGPHTAPRAAFYATSSYLSKEYKVPNRDTLFQKVEIMTMSGGEGIFF